MANNTKLQLMMFALEASFGAGVAGDFSATGYRGWNNGEGALDLSNIKQLLAGGEFTIGSAKEITPPAELGKEENSFTFTPVMAGASLDVSDQYDEDGLDVLLEASIGTLSYPAANDATDTGCSTTDIIVAGAAEYVAGQVVMIGGISRMIESWTLGTKTIVLTMPLPSAPAAGVAIYNMGSYDSTTAGSSLAWGFRHAISNADYLVNGAFCEEPKLSTLNNSDHATIELPYIAQWAEVGASKITNVATDEIPTDVVSPRAGGIVHMMAADGTTLLSLHGKEAECGLGYKGIPVPVFTSRNGIGGYEKTPVDGQGRCRLILWESDALTREKIVALIGTTTSVVVQFGNTRGKTIGVIYPEAAIAEQEPRFVDMDGVWGIEVMLKVPVGYLFRG